MQTSAAWKEDAKIVDWNSSEYQEGDGFYELISDEFVSVKEGSPSITTDSEGKKHYVFPGGSGSYTPSQFKRNVSDAEYENAINSGYTTVTEITGSAGLFPQSPDHVNRVEIIYTGSSPITVYPGGHISGSPVNTNLWDCTTWAYMKRINNGIYYSGGSVVVSPTTSYQVRDVYIPSSGSAGSGGGGEIVVTPSKKAHKVFVQAKLHDAVTSKIKAAYKKLVSGDAKTETKTFLVKQN